MDSNFQFRARRAGVLTGLYRRRPSKVFAFPPTSSLARLWRDQHRITEARALLGSVYGRFTEGFQTADLREASNLLEELA
jgi:predicted ATPase